MHNARQTSWQPGQGEISNYTLDDLVKAVYNPADKLLFLLKGNTNLYRNYSRDFLAYELGRYKPIKDFLNVLHASDINPVFKYRILHGIADYINEHSEDSTILFRVSQHLKNDVLGFPEFGQQLYASMALYALLLQKGIIGATLTPVDRALKFTPFRFLRVKDIGSAAYQKFLEHFAFDPRFEKLRQFVGRHLKLDFMLPKILPREFFIDIPEDIIKQYSLDNYKNYISDGRRLGQLAIIEALPIGIRARGR